MRLNVADREALQKSVQIFFVNNKNCKKSDVVNHFVKQEYYRQTIYNQINRLKNDSPIQNSKRTGRPTTWTAPPRVQKLKRLTNNRHGISLRQLSKKLDMDQSSICRKLSKMNIKYRKREKTPKYCAVQRVKAQKLARKLVYELYKSKA